MLAFNERSIMFSQIGASLDARVVEAPDSPELVAIVFMVVFIVAA